MKRESALSNKFMDLINFNLPGSKQLHRQKLSLNPEIKNKFHHDPRDNWNCQVYLCEYFLRRHIECWKQPLDFNPTKLFENLIVSYTLYANQLYSNYQYMEVRKRHPALKVIELLKNLLAHPFEHVCNVCRFGMYTYTQYCR